MCEHVRDLGAMESLSEDALPGPVRLEPVEYYAKIMQYGFIQQ